MTMLPVRIIIPLSLSENEEQSILTFDELSCGLPLEEVIKASALNVLYAGQFSVMSNVFLSYWEDTYFKQHVDNESLDAVVGVTLTLFDMFVTRMNIILNSPFLFGTGRDLNVKIDFKHDYIELTWGIYVSDTNI